MFRYLVILIVLITLLISSNGLFVITDVCNSTANVGGLRYINNGFERCQSMTGNPTTYGFVPICDSSIYSCDNCDLTCQNGGTCVVQLGRSSCLCPQNWGGTTCNIQVNDCVLGTVCLTNGIPFQRCEPSVPFAEPFIDDNCQTPGINCNPSSCSVTCQNNGRCITIALLGIPFPGCLCANGYEGNRCENMITPSNISTLCSAGYNVSAMWALIVLAVFALYVISLM